MADTYTPLLRFIMQQDMQNENQWGSIFNTAVTDLVEEALGAKVIVDVTFGNETLNSQNGLSDQSRHMFIEAIGNPGTKRVITVPTLTKLYGVGNNTFPTEPIEIKTATGSGIEITQSQSPTIVFVDSVNDSVHVLGRTNAIEPASQFIEVDLFEDGQTLVVADAVYSVQGTYVTIIIPIFSHTFTGLLRRLRFTSNAGVVPAAIKYTATPPISFPVWAVDGTIGFVQTFMQMNVSNNFIEYFAADPDTAAFTNNQSLQVNYRSILQYSLKTSPP